MSRWFIFNKRQILASSVARQYIELASAYVSAGQIFAFTTLKMLKRLIYEQRCLYFFCAITMVTTSLYRRCMLTVIKLSWFNIHSQHQPTGNTVYAIRHRPHGDEQGPLDVGH